MTSIQGDKNKTVTDKPLNGLPLGVLPRAVDCQVDVVVVGLGPAGLIACRDFAKQGFRVLGIDRKMELGAPKRCAEGISAEGLSSCGIEPDPAWAYSYIEGAALYAPSQQYVRLENAHTKGWVVERKVFEKHLARDAILAGAKLMPKTQAIGLLKNDQNTLCGIRAIFMGKAFNIQAPLTIAADGVDSMVGKWAGLRTLNRVRDYHSGFQYEMVGVKHLKPDWLHLYFGEQVAPKGYIWVFPKGQDVFNVGIGILAQHSHWGARAQDYLDRWIEANPAMFNEAGIIEMNGSGIPVSSRVPEPVSSGLMVLGDAAQLVNPIHGGGIVIAMRSAIIAAKVGSEALRKGDVSKAALMPYVNEYWHQDKGAITEKLLRLRYFSEHLTDKDFERLVQILDGNVIHELTKAKFPTFLKILLRHLPKVAPLVRKYMLAVKQKEHEDSLRSWDEIDELLQQAEETC